MRHAARGLILDISMLPTTLNTNEVKDAAGAEIQFGRLSVEGRKLVFAKEGEAPNLQHRLTISHSETGSGSALRRRSMVRFDKDVAGVSLEKRRVSAYVVLDAPVGDLAADTELKAVMANVMSFVASLGASTTILYDSTGNGASALVSGQL